MPVPLILMEMDTFTVLIHMVMSGKKFQLNLKVPTWELSLLSLTCPLLTGTKW